jgi:flagellar motor protein MotB
VFPAGQAASNRLIDNQLPKEGVMKNWIAAAMGLMLAVSPLAFAQDKADEKKAAAAQAAPKAEEKKAAPAKEAPKAGEKKAAKAAKKEQQKKEPTAKQKAQQEKMRACAKDAGAKKLKGDERKKFMSTCMKG